MPRTINRSQGREVRDRIGEGVGEAKKRNKPFKESYRRDVENGGRLGRKEQTKMSAQKIIEN